MQRGARLAGGWLLAAAAAIVAVSLLVRLPGLGTHEFWLDEAFSFQDATAPRWLADLPRRDMPPLYTVLLRGWIDATGAEEATLRLPSAVLGALFVVVTMWTAHAMFCARVALIAGVVAALAPLHVYYSQEARPYALLVLLLAATLAAVHRAVVRGHGWVLVTALATLVLYTHYLGALGLLGTGGLLLVAPSARAAIRWVAALAVAAAAFVPWIVLSFVLVSHSTAGLEWIAEAWARTPLAIPRSLELFAFGPRAGFLPIALKQFESVVVPGPLRWLGIAGLLLLAAGLALPRAAAPLDVPALGRRVAALFVALLVPLVALWAVSFVKPIYLAGRYDMLGFPAFPILAGVGFVRLAAVRAWGRRLAAVAALALLVPVGTSLAAYHRAAARRPGQSAAAAGALAATVADGDAVVFTDLRGHLVLFQLARLGWEWSGSTCASPTHDRFITCRLLPESLVEAAGRRDGTAREALGTEITAALAARRNTPRTVHLVHGTWAVGPQGLMLLPGASDWPSGQVQVA